MKKRTYLIAAAGVAVAGAGVVVWRNRAEVQTQVNTVRAGYWPRVNVKEGKA